VPVKRSKLRLIDERRTPCRPATICSLLRLASATARLRLAAEVQVFPDCVLSILLVEKAVSLKVRALLLNAVGRGSQHPTATIEATAVPQRACHSLPCLCCHGQVIGDSSSHCCAC
jgi:hypothetical protein